MLSKVDVCNMALAQLGQEPISSLQQEDERARRCSLFYEPVKKEVLRTHNWAFAACEAALALLDERRGGEWPYAYAYPADCLFLRKVYAPAQPQRARAFKEMYQKDLHARTILCAVPQAYAEYTRDVTDATLFDPAFVKAFSLALGADLAVALSGDASLAHRLLQKYTLALDEARRSNMTERFDVCAPQSAFVEVR